MRCRSSAVLCGMVVSASAGGARALETRYAADTALGARWVEHATDVRVLVAQETEVTRAQWMAVMGDGPKPDASCSSDDCPATLVTPLSMMVFANQLSDLEGLERCYEIVGGEGVARVGTLANPSSVVINPHCGGYRLPTLAEWSALIETEPYSRPGTPVSWLERVGVVARTSPDENARPVATRWPSYGGLYDLVGNVVEVALLPEPRPDVAVLDRALLPASIVMLGCAIGERPERCLHVHPIPGRTDWGGARFGFRLVRTYPATH